MVCQSIVQQYIVGSSTLCQLSGTYYHIIMQCLFMITALAIQSFQHPTGSEAAAVS